MKIFLDKDSQGETLVLFSESPKENKQLQEIQNILNNKKIFRFLASTTSSGKSKLKNSLGLISESENVSFHQGLDQAYRDILNMQLTNSKFSILEKLKLFFNTEKQIDHLFINYKAAILQTLSKRMAQNGI